MIGTLDERDLFIYSIINGGLFMQETYKAVIESGLIAAVLHEVPPESWLEWSQVVKLQAFSRPTIPTTVFFQLILTLLIICDNVYTVIIMTNSDDARPNVGIELIKCSRLATGL